MADPYTIDNVPVWMIARGVGHIVAGPGFGSGWARWACGTQTPYEADDIIRFVPRRICKKFRAVLSEHREIYLKQLRADA